MIVNKFRLQLVKDKGVSYPEYDRQLGGPSEVAALLFDLGLDREPLEQFWALLMDSRGKFIGLTRASSGSVGQAIIDPRGVFVPALLGNAVSVILVHNHPSGDVDPSQADMTTTRKLVDAGKLLGVTVADHIIIGFDGDYFSFSREGLI